MDQVVDYLQRIGFIVEPRRDQIFEAGAFPGRKAAGATVVNLIALDPKIGRAALEVDAPIVGVVDAVINNMAILHRDKVNRILFSPVDIVALQVDILRLIHFDIFMRPGAAAEQSVVAQQQVVTALTVKNIAGVGNVEVADLQVGDIGDVEITQQAGTAIGVRPLENNGECRGAVAIFPILGESALRIVACCDQDAVAGAGQPYAAGDALPGGRDRGEGVVAVGTAVVVITVGPVNPEVGDRLSAGGAQIGGIRRLHAWQSA